MSSHIPTIPTAEDTSLILQRYNARQAHHLVYTYDELRALGIPPEFLLALLEVFEDHRLFHPENFDRFQLAVIIDYLQKTHAYYLAKKLPEIEQSIYLLMEAYESGHPLLKLLKKFYHEYESHLRRHIEMEERELLPHILLLEKSEATNNSHIVQHFIEQHHDTEKDLGEIRKTILHYSPPLHNQTLYRILLSQIEILEKDLAIHALMEDAVLLPRALKMEKRINP